MKVTYKGTEVQIAPNNLPAFSFAIQGDLDLSTIKGSSSTTFKLPASIATRSIAGSPVMAEARDNGGELRIGIADEDYHRATVRPVEIDRNEVRLVALGGNASWMEALKKTKINTLRLGESEPVGIAMQKATWYDDESALIFPLINYGYLQQRSSSFDVDVRYLRPGVRTWKILRSAFASVGYAIKVEGALTRYWKKLFMPNVVESVPALPQYLEQFTVDLSLSTPFAFTPYFSAGFTSIPVDTVDNDPSSSALVAPPNIYYASSKDMTIGVTCTFTASVQYSSLLGQARRFRVYVVPQSSGIPVALRDVYFRDDTILQTRTFELDFGDVPFEQGENYRLIIRRWTVDTPDYFSVDAAIISYAPTAIPYQGGIGFDIGKSLPNVAVMDVLRTIVNAYCLVVDTDDATKTVTVKEYDDYVKPIVEGQDMEARCDHSKPPVRKRPRRPSSILFKFNDDDKDEGLKQFRDTRNRTLVEYTLTNPLGEMDGQNVAAQLAATALTLAFDGFLIPNMAEDEGDFQVDKYKRSPRIMVHNGVDGGEWTHDGVAMTEYPNCYFAKPGQEFNMAFGREDQYGDTGPGTIDRKWKNRLRRFIDSDVLTIEVRLLDDELKDVDFGRPIRAHDGHDGGWYLYQKINQKRFGTDETTSCDLTQY